MSSERVGPAEKRSASHRCSSSTRFTYGNGTPVHEEQMGRRPCPACGPAGRALAVRRVCVGGSVGSALAVRRACCAPAAGGLVHGLLGVRPCAAGRVVHGPLGPGAGAVGVLCALPAARRACVRVPPGALAACPPDARSRSGGRPAHGPSGVRIECAGRPAVACGAFRHGLPGALSMVCRAVAHGPSGVRPRAAGRFVGGLPGALLADHQACIPRAGRALTVRRVRPARGPGRASGRGLPGALFAVGPGVSAVCCVRASPTSRTPRSGPPSPR